MRHMGEDGTTRPRLEPHRGQGRAADENALAQLVGPPLPPPDRSMRWGNHACCEACWIAREAIVEQALGGLIITGVRTPHRVRDVPLSRCCLCGNLTISGIYVRATNAQAPECEGHDDEEQRLPEPPGEPPVQHP